jgi:hypothetical protein
MTVEVPVSIDSLELRLDRAEREIARLRRSRWAMVGLAAVAFFLPSAVLADKPRSDLWLSTADGSQQARFLPSGFLYSVGGQDRLKLDLGDKWSYLTLFRPDGSVAWGLGSDEGGTAMKIFSKDQKLRVEVNEELIDSGAGLRLYDHDGKPRATLYADKRGGESGLELTDANRQPRIDVYAEPDGVTVMRASTSAADASAELSILPESDAYSRYTGMVPTPTENEPFVPMLYMLDRSGTNTLVTPVSPH